jgi:hypothetical protein
MYGTQDHRGDGCIRNGWLHQWLGKLQTLLRSEVMSDKNFAPPGMTVRAAAKRCFAKIRQYLPYPPLGSRIFCRFLAMAGVGLLSKR